MDDIADISLKSAVQIGTPATMAPNPLDNINAEVLSSEVIQPPPGDAGFPLTKWANCDGPYCKHHHKVDPHIAQPSAKAYVNSTQSILASSHCWIMPSCNRSAQLDVLSSLSPVESSNSVGRLPSDELSIAGGKGDVDTDAGSNPRNEHVLLSYSELSRFKYNVECLHAAGHIKTSYADITKRGVEIDVAVEPSKGAPPLSLQPISTEDRVAALGRSFCHDEVIGSTEVGSSHDGVPADPPGDVPMPCTNIGVLRKNIAEMRKQFDDPRDCLVIPPPSSIDSLPSPKDGGSSFSSLQKSKRRKKKRSPIPHN
ncbi:hypothetical protein Nepgr_030846 [Nepenthes gracilis]|uniref:Uncharacterized protein n=1 Tax=Nepenthes gracilis TaxID=150966 RepID=A0AAD3THB6_NEPGR|nr:hypothetical protein Nepgr_030846 [Nepenthes gracilis]